MSPMKSFWNLTTLEKGALLTRLVQRLSSANLTSLPMLAEARGQSVDEVWASLCREAGLEPCRVPHHLFGTLGRAGPESGEPAASHISPDSPGARARAKVLAQLERAGPSRAWHAARLRDSRYLAR